MQIEWYRGYQIRLMFWDESFLLLEGKENEIKQKEYGETAISNGTEAARGIPRPGPIER